MMLFRIFCTFAIALVAREVRAEQPVSFANEVAAILSRTGCNAGACHGNFNGKGGFKLSLRGESAAFDYTSLTRDMLARRIDLAHPDESLLLKKASGQASHEGGVRFGRSSSEYAILRNWIAAGASFDGDTSPKLTRLEVSPQHRVLVSPTDRVALTVVAHFADGTQRDVRTLAAYETTNIGVVNVQPNGEIVKLKNGEAVVLVRYLSQQVPVRLAFIADSGSPNVSILNTGQRLDALVAQQLQELRLQPSVLSSDAEFVRRVYFDACGIPPSPEGVRAFLANRDPNKREALIDHLLSKQEFAEFWAMKWSDLLRNEEKSLDRKGVQVYYRWMKSRFEADRPLNEFAKEILTARGSTYENPPTNFFRAVRDPLQRAESVAQVFLGVRISCARCHNHPFDVWTQDEYFRFAAFFPRIDYRILKNERRDNLDKHEFIGEQIVFADRKSETIHPRTGVPAAPKFLGADTPDLMGDADRLGALAEWIAKPDNPFFAKAQANRIWFHLMGRGLVDPNDDFKVTNPASNPELLDYLAAEFRAGGFRVKPFVKQILMSATYQLSSRANDSNEFDESHFSHAIIQPLEAEPLLDAMSRVFDVAPEFRGYPSGTRAGSLPAMLQGGGGRRGSATMSERFLKVFGKPERLLTCECERSDEPGVIQVFQMINGEQVNRMLRAENNRIGQALKKGVADAELLEELFLAAISRYPNDIEKSKLLATVSSATDKRSAWEDIAWGLVNSKEFLLRR